MSEPSPFDPRLKAAMAEIQEVCTRYDVALSAMIVSATHSEYAWQFPTWSCARFGDVPGADMAIRIRARRQDFTSRAGQLAALDATVHLLAQLDHWHEESHEVSRTIYKMVEDAIPGGIENTTRDHGYEPHTKEGEQAAQDPRNQAPRGPKRPDWPLRR